ncbi:MAG: hypothetical protein ACREA0_24020, partial [bacterium]
MPRRTVHIYGICIQTVNSEALTPTPATSASSVPIPPRRPKSAGSGKAWPILGSGRTLAQTVYEVVRDRIIAGELAPRFFVREEELAGA